MSSEQRRRLERVQNEQRAPQPPPSIQTGQQLQRRDGEYGTAAAAASVSDYKLELERKRHQLYESEPNSNKYEWQCARAAVPERNGQQLVQTIAKRAPQLIERHERPG